MSPVPPNAITDLLKRDQRSSWPPLAFSSSRLRGDMRKQGSQQEEVWIGKA